MSRAARLRCFKTINTSFIVDLQAIGLRAAARRQAADDDLGLGVLEALRDVVEIFALGARGSSAVERQRALRPRDRRGRVAPPNTLPHDGLADVARGSDDSDFFISLIYTWREGHAQRRGAQRRRSGREEEDASHLQRMTRLRCSCVAESASRSCIIVTTLGKSSSVAACY